MAKSNAQKCRDYRKRQPKALRVPLPEGTEAALNDLMEWHGFEDGREAVATFIHRLHEMGPEGSRAAFEIKRVGYTPSDEVLSRLGGPL